MLENPAAAMAEAIIAKTEAIERARLGALRTAALEAADKREREEKRRIEAAEVAQARAEAAARRKLETERDGNLTMLAATLTDLRSKPGRANAYDLTKASQEIDLLVKWVALVTPVLAKLATEDGNAGVTDNGR